MIEIIGKQFDINRRGHENHFEIFSLSYQTFDNTHDEVGEQMPFVDFIDHENIVIGESGIGLQLTEKDPLGHEDNSRGFDASFFEANLVSDLIIVLVQCFVTDAFGEWDAGDTTRLCAGDFLEASLQ